MYTLITTQQLRKMGPIKYGDKIFSNTSRLDDIYESLTMPDVPANGGKVNVKGLTVYSIQIC